MSEAQAQVQEQQSIETSKAPLALRDISQLGHLSKTVKVFDGVSVTLQTLSATRQQKVLSLLPASDDAIIKFAQMQIETLAMATVAINDQQYTDADRDFLREWYGNLQAPVLQEFYAVYNDLLEEQDKILNSLKKK